MNTPGRCARASTRAASKLKTDWEHLQRPGLSPDFTLAKQYEGMYRAYERSDWKPTVGGGCHHAGQLACCWPTLAASRRPSPARTTISCPVKTVEKQLIVINNSRETVTSDCDWSLELGKGAASSAGRKRVTVPTGQQEQHSLSGSNCRWRSGRGRTI